MQIPSLPRWIDSLSGQERAAATQRFFLRTAALHASESGTLRELASALGRSKNALTRYVADDAELIPVELAIDLERLVGRDTLPREALRPDIFVIPTS
jgi:hypothetical protein